MNGAEHNKVHVQLETAKLGTNLDSTYYMFIIISYYVSTQCL